MQNGNLGISLLYLYAGNPTGVSTQGFNPPVGSLVLDVSTPALWQKVSADNSSYNQLAVTVGATLNGVTLTGTTNVTGTLTQTVNQNVIAAAGTNQGNAAALGTQSIQQMSSASSAAGVILASTAGIAAGQAITQTIFNTSGTAAKIYPDSGGNINYGSVNASVVVPASTGVRATCIAPTQTILGATTQTSTTVSLASTAGLVVGQTLSGNGIQASTTISTLSTGSIIISANATATASGVSLVFGSAWISEELNTLG